MHRSGPYDPAVPEPAAEIVEIRADGAGARVYEVRRVGLIGRLALWLAIGAGLALGLVILIPLMLAGLALVAMVAVAGLVLTGLARARSALTPTGRRNVRVIRRPHA